MMINGRSSEKWKVFINAAKYAYIADRWLLWLPKWCWNSVIYHLKLFILHKKTQKIYPFMQVLSTHQSESKKIWKNQIPKIAHILYKASYCVGDGVVVIFCVAPNWKLILHLNYIYIYLHHSLDSRQRIGLHFRCERTRKKGVCVLTTTSK